MDFVRDTVVSNGKIVIKYIFSCVHYTGITLNDKLIVIAAQLFMMIIGEPSRFNLM